MKTMQAPDKTTYLTLAVVLGAILLLYFPFLQKLVKDWGTNDDYSHGYFIPFLSLYMIYSIRDELIKIPIKPSNAGLVVILAGLAQLIIAKIGLELFLERTSLLVVVCGVILFFLGPGYLKKLLFPVLYLIFMIPLPAIIWNKISFPLQLFASDLTEKVISAFGIPIFRDGNVLHLAQTTLEVVAACSGLRSLVTMFALSAMLAFLSDLSLSRRWILFLSAAPIAIFANIVRLTVTALLASKYGSEVAHGFLHGMSGVLTFVLGLSLLVIANKFLDASWKKKVA
jgi:exosortase A